MIFPLFLIFRSPITTVSQTVHLAFLTSASTPRIMSTTAGSTAISRIKTAMVVVLPPPPRPCLRDAIFLPLLLLQALPPHSPWRLLQPQVALLVLYQLETQPPPSQPLWTRKSQNWNDSGTRSIKKVIVQPLPQPRPQDQHQDQDQVHPRVHKHHQHLQTVLQKSTLADTRRSCADHFLNMEPVNMVKNVNLRMDKLN